MKSLKSKIDNLKSNFFNLRNVRRKATAVIMFAILTISAYQVWSYLTPNTAEAGWSPAHKDWLKRKRVPLINTTTEELASTITVAVTVNTKELYDLGHLQADCDDLRIAYQSGSTNTDVTRHLVYEAGQTCSTSNATRVYFPLQATLAASGQSTDYYVYYHNPNADTPTTTVDAFDVSGANALLVCPFNGTTECINGNGAESPTTATGAIRYGDEMGSALSFDGVNDFVNAGSDSSIDDLLIKGDVTIEGYFKFPDQIPASDSEFLISKDQNQSQKWSIQFINDTNDFIRFIVWTDSDTINATTFNLPVPNEWYHIAATWNLTSKETKLYFNGVLVGSDTGTGIPLSDAPNNLIIGNDINGAQESHVEIDEVRISNIIRYTSNFTPQTSPFISDENTLLLYHFDENGDDPRNTGKALDSSGLNNHGTITGAKYVKGVVGIDNSSQVSNVPAQSFASKEGVFIEEGTTNKITNPSFDHATYNTGWDAVGANLTVTEQTAAPYVKFGSKAAKIVASGTGANDFTIGIDPNSTATHTLSAYVYDGTTGNVGGTVSSSIAQLVWQGTAQSGATYTDMGGGWWRITYSAATTDAVNEYGIQVADTKTVYVDGVQLEAKSQATSYTDGSLVSDAGGNDTYFWDDNCNGTLDAGEDETGDQHTQCSSRIVGNLKYSSTNNIDNSKGAVSLWVKTPSLVAASSQPPIFNYFNNGQGYIIRYSSFAPAGFNLVKYHNWSQYVIGTTSSLTPNTWYHLVATYDTVNGIALYLNAGTPSTHSNTNLPDITADISIGGLLGSGSMFKVSDVRIYNDVLSATQVTDLYQAGLVTHQSDSAIDRYGSESQKPVAIWHMDEGYGTTLNDSTINNHNLTISGASWKTDIQPGNPRARYLSFDGTDDYARGTYPALNFRNRSFTLSSWFRHSSTAPASGTDTLISKYSTAGYKIYMNTSGQICFGIDADSTWTPTDSACSTASFADSRWHHVSAVKDGTSSITLYVDGVQVAQDATLSANGSLSNGGYFYLGIDSDGTSNPWEGDMDSVVVYDYARSSDEIKADFAGANASQVFGMDTDDSLMNGLVGWWKMDESSDNAIDSSGNGVTLTNNGTTTFVGGKFGNGTEHIPASSQYFSTATTINGVKSVTFWVNPDSSTNYLLSLTSGAYITASSGTLSATGFDNPRIYVNGVQTTTIAADTWQLITVLTVTAINADQLYVGRQGDNYFDGTMDEVRLYNRALSPDEIKNLYNWAPGPVGYWPIDEGSGTVVSDSSGNGLTGSFGGDPTWTQGRAGKALSFDGDDDSISISDNDLIDFNYNQDFTIGFWAIDGSGNTVGTDELISKFSGGSYPYVIRYTSGGAIYLARYDGTNNPNTTSTTTLSTTEWKYFTAQKSGSSIKMYVNGTLEHSASDTTTTTTTNAAALSLARRSGTSTYWSGKLDDVKIYNYARTPEQIIVDMNAGHPIGGSPVGSAVAHWKLDEMSGTSAYDASINANTLTLNSASWTADGSQGGSWKGTGSTWMSRADDSDFDVGATDDYSVSLWFKSASVTNPASTEYLFNKASATVAGYAIYLNTSGQVCFGIDDDTTWNPDVQVCSTADVYDGSWHQVTAVRDVTADKVNLYVDRTLVASATDTTTATLANSLSLYVGDRDGVDNGSEFNGFIDDIKVYRAALTQDQVNIVGTQSKAAVFGALGTDASGNPSSSLDRSYCPPGDTTATCGPVAHWTFDEKSGTSTTKDISGNVNDGSLTGITAQDWIRGKIGSALNFSSGKYVSASNSNGSLSNFWDGGGTFSAWINPTAITCDSFAARIMGRVWTQIYLSGASSPASLNVFQTFTVGGSGNTVTTANSSIPLNQWSHVTAVYNSDSNANVADIYINGIKQNVSSTNTGTGTRNSDTGTLFLGNNNSSSASFCGGLDNVKIYNYARTPAQIAWDYNRGAPVGWWKMDESSWNGTTGEVKDTSGNGFNGTGAGGVTTVNGKFNRAGDFDGTDDYVSVADTANLRFDSGSQDFSMFAWVKRNTSGATHYIISKEDADNDGYRLQFDSGNTITCSVDAIDITSSSTITDTNWHHIGCVVNRAGNGQVYIDGKPDGAGVAISSEVMATTSSIRLGSRSYTPANYLNGMLDDVRFYQYALTPQQVKLIMAGGAVSFR